MQSKLRKCQKSYEMCGIIFADLIGRANKRVLKRYNAQSKRGTQGYGCVCIEHGLITKVFRSKAEHEIRKNMKSVQSNTMLMHHRNPTSSPNIEECNHPIYVHNDMLDFDYLVVHNGVIENAKSLKTIYEKKGFTYTTEVVKIFKSKISNVEHLIEESFNDSESFAIDIAITIESDGKMIDSNGSIAFVALQVDKENSEVKSVYFGRNFRNPLKIDHTNTELFLSSEGRGKDVEPNMLHNYDLKTKNISSKSLHIGYKLPEPPKKEEEKTDLLPPPRNEKPTLFGGHEVYYKPYFDGNDVKITFFSHRLSESRTKKFGMVGESLSRIGIKKEHMNSMSNYDWDEYDELNTEIDINVSIISAGKKGDIPLNDDERREIQNELRSLFLRLKTLRDRVTNRADKF